MAFRRKFRHSICIGFFWGQWRYISSNRSRHPRTTFSSTIFPISLSIARERFRAQPDPLKQKKKKNELRSTSHKYTQNTLLTAFYGYFQFQFQWNRGPKKNENTNTAWNLEICENINTMNTYRFFWVFPCSSGYVYGYSKMVWTENFFQFCNFVNAI